MYVCVLHNSRYIGVYMYIACLHAYICRCVQLNVYIGIRVDILVLVCISVQVYICICVDGLGDLMQIN